MKSEVLRLSKVYHSIIRECIDDLNAKVTQSRDAEGITHKHHLTIFYNIEKIWHMTEIFYVNTVPGKILSHL